MGLVKRSDVLGVVGLGLLVLPFVVEPLHQRWLGWYYSRPVVLSRAGW